ncbi:hypothetical protein ACQPU1_11235 [Clostridium paraputrificum]|uniref:hypothetical protein n=1 Tax=Clostridium TaxID=1485 RepID=UPI003D358673
MKFKLEKNLKIINELIAYCYKIGSSDVNVHIQSTDKSTIFKVLSIVDNLSHTLLEELTETLNTKRQREVEQYYWNLGGESEFDSELSLVGMMIDMANVRYEFNKLSIEILRIEEY